MVWEAFPGPDLEVGHDELVLGHGAAADVITAGQVEAEDQDEAEEDHNGRQHQHRVPDLLAGPGKMVDTVKRAETCGACMFPASPAARGRTRSRR